MTAELWHGLPLLLSARVTGKESNEMAHWMNLRVIPMVAVTLWCTLGWAQTGNFGQGAVPATRALPSASRANSHAYPATSPTVQTTPIGGPMAGSGHRGQSSERLTNRPGQSTWSQNPVGRFESESRNSFAIPAHGSDLSNRNRGWNSDRSVRGTTVSVADSRGMAWGVDEPRLSREQQAAPPTRLDFPTGGLGASGVPIAASVPSYQGGYAMDRGSIPTSANPQTNPFGVPQMRGQVESRADTNLAAGTRVQSEGTRRPTSGLLLGLLFSLALNLFLAWITWDTHNRYQDLIDDIDELEARRLESRGETGGRLRGGRRSAREYDGMPLEASESTV